MYVISHKLYWFVALCDLIIIYEDYYAPIRNQKRYFLGWCR